MMTSFLSILIAYSSSVPFLSANSTCAIIIIIIIIITNKKIRVGVDN